MHIPIVPSQPGSPPTRPVSKGAAMALLGTAAALVTAFALWRVIGPMEMPRPIVADAPPPPSGAVASVPPRPTRAPVSDTLTVVVVGEAHDEAAAHAWLHATNAEREANAVPSR